VEEKKEVAEEKKEVVEEKMDAAGEKIEAAEGKKEAVGENKDVEDEKMEAVEEKKEVVEEIELTQQNNPEDPFKYQLENGLIIYQEKENRDSRRLIVPTDCQNNAVNIFHESNAHLGIKKCVHVHH
jgi:hypothetical protein